MKSLDQIINACQGAPATTERPAASATEARLVLVRGEEWLVLPEIPWAEVRVSPQVGKRFHLVRTAEGRAFYFLRRYRFRGEERWSWNDEIRTHRGVWPL